MRCSKVRAHCAGAQERMPERRRLGAASVRPRRAWRSAGARAPRGSRPAPAWRRSCRAPSSWLTQPPPGQRTSRQTTSIQRMKQVMQRTVPACCAVVHPWPWIAHHNLDAGMPLDTDFSDHSHLCRPVVIICVCKQNAEGCASWSQNYRQRSTS